MWWAVVVPQPDVVVAPQWDVAGEAAVPQQDAVAVVQPQPDGGGSTAAGGGGADGAVDGASGEAG